MSSSRINAAGLSANLSLALPERKPADAAEEQLLQALYEVGVGRKAHR